MRNLQKKRFKYFLAIIKNKITLDRIKSNYFRVLHMNGLSVELMPKVENQIILGNERDSMPKIVRILSSDGVIDDPIEECKRN